MKMTDEGVKLIMTFEGFRAEAYKDPVGVWTIGFGHTSAAGEPAVAGGLKVTREEAEIILKRDVENFATGVAAKVTAALDDAQFSALVSFAYNVGLANFAKSSVLAAVNKGDLAAVPRRLQMWTKAGGRVLPGLVKRRAAEAALFVSGPGSDETASAPVEPVPGKVLPKSTTALAAIISALAGLLGLSGLAQHFVVLTSLAIAGGAAWVLRERHRISKQEGV